MTDRVLNAFLGRQLRDGMALAAASDLLELVALGAEPPQRYVATFTCKGLVKSPDGAIVEAERFVVGIWFPDDYLRVADPFTVLTWLEPRSSFHPNISDVGPFLCVGRITPGTTLVDLLYRCFEVITYQRLAPHDALNREASAWARHHMERFPVDRRPLKRRRADFVVEPLDVTP